MIEQRLIDGSNLREKVVLQHFLRKQRSVRGPVVFVGPRSMLSNAAASRVMDPGDEELLRDDVQRMVSEGRLGFEDITLRTGRRLSIRCEKVLDGGDPIGIMVELRGGSNLDVGLGDPTVGPTPRRTGLTRRAGSRGVGRRRVHQQANSRATVHLRLHGGLSHSIDLQEARREVPPGTHSGRARPGTRRPQLSAEDLDARHNRGWLRRKLQRASSVLKLRCEVAAHFGFPKAGPRSW